MIHNCFPISHNSLRWPQKSLWLINALLLAAWAFSKLAIFYYRKYPLFSTPNFPNNGMRKHTPRIFLFYWNFLQTNHKQEGHVFWMTPMLNRNWMVPRRHYKGNNVEEDSPPFLRCCESIDSLITLIQGRKIQQLDSWLSQVMLFWWRTVSNPRQTLQVTPIW